jgi:hypothetical protein
VRVLVALVAVPCLVCSPISALADDTTQVNLTDAGPDRPIPIGSSFYLAGTAAPTTRSIQAVIVRTGHPLLLWPDRPTCSALSEQLVTSAPAEKAVTPGRSPARVAFPHATAHGGDPALASAAWLRGDATGKPDFKLLVSADAGFLQAGFTYCLFVIEERSLTDDQHIAAALEALGKAAATCALDQQDCAGPACAAKALGCAHAAELQYDQAVTKALGGAGKAAEATRTAATAEIGDARDFHRAAAEFGRSARIFATPYGLGQPPRWRRIDGSGDDDDGIAAYLASRLTVTPSGLLPLPSPRAPLAGPIAAIVRFLHGLVSWWNVDPPRPHIAKYAPDGAYQVTQLQILDNGVDIRVAADAITKDQPFKTLTAKTSDVRIAQDVTLRDLLLLADDRIMVGTKEVALDPLRKRMNDVSLEVSDQEFQVFVDASARLDTLTTAIQTIRSVSGDADRSSDDAPAVVAGQLVRWLDVHQGKVDGKPSKVLERETNELRAIVEAHRSWQTRRSSLAFTAEQRPAARMVATTTVRFDQRSWVFTYLTPIIGYAALEDAFTIPYAGVQLHLVPNPVNEPQWSNGASDFGRFVGLELAASLHTGNFGPDDRYTGIDSIPPVFIGAAFHPIPYTSLSIGQVLLKRRASALPAEQPAFTHEWYFGLNVQANIPDLVRTLMNPTTNTVVEKK